MDESEARRLIREHFESAMVDDERSAAIYADDAVIEFPQSGERIRGRENIVAFRSAYPARVTFEMDRTIGSGNLWVNEYTVRYLGDATRYVAGIMEFRDGRVVRERLYVAETWEPPGWRAQWVEPIPPEPHPWP